MKNLFNPYFLGNQFSDKSHLKNRVWMLYQASNHKNLWKITLFLPVILICCWITYSAQSPENQLEKMWKNAEIDALIFLTNRDEFLGQKTDKPNHLASTFDSLKNLYPEQVSTWNTRNIQKNLPKGSMNFSFRKHLKPKAYYINHEDVLRVEKLPQPFEIQLDKSHYKVTSYTVQLYQNPEKFGDIQKMKVNLKTPELINELSFGDIQYGFNILEKVKKSSPNWQKEFQNSKVDFSEIEVTKPSIILLKINEIQYNPSADTLWNSKIDDQLLLFYLP